MTKKKHPGGRPLKYKTDKALSKAIDIYFKKCEEDHKHPTISGLAYSLDMNRSAITDYKNRDKFSHTIKKARLYIESYLEQMLFGGQVTGVIFNLKNNFGWKDVQDINQNLSGTIGLSQAMDQAEKDNGIIPSEDK